MITEYCQWCRDELKSGGTCLAGKFFCRTHPLLLALQVQIVVLVSDFVMVSRPTVWSVFLFAGLLLTVPPVPSHLKKCLLCLMESAPLN